MPATPSLHTCCGEADPSLGTGAGSASGGRSASDTMSRASSSLTSGSRAVPSAKGPDVRMPLVLRGGSAEGALLGGCRVQLGQGIVCKVMWPNHLLQDHLNVTWMGIKPCLAAPGAGVQARCTRRP